MMIVRPRFYSKQKRSSDAIINYTQKTKYLTTPYQKDKDLISIHPPQQEVVNNS
jgi:hypothetical protein